MIFSYIMREAKRKCGYSDNDPLQDPCRHARIHTVEWTADGKPILNGREK